MEISYLSSLWRFGSGPANAQNGGSVDASVITNYGVRMKTILVLLTMMTGIAAFSAAIELTTIAEQSNWIKTGRADETERLCKDFAKKFPNRVQCQSYGKTPEGRTMWYMQIHDKKINANAPVVWLQAGIHAGEIDGKDAVFLMMRNVLEKKLTPDPFKGLKVVFIPIVNLDGHERFGKWNRPKPAKCVI
ncbi:MAG: hypothetical protein B7Y39_07065 [Bdellovibrio sp. 28-41-41]|nr:MAG: hypothetical protein B7Y39_07065 [Bdellovibrio sp. 28-41-41]